VSAFPGALAAHAEAYRNTARHNGFVHRMFAAATAADPLLDSHRNHAVRHGLGCAGPNRVFERMG
jgi:hypothetical protein